MKRVLWMTGLVGMAAVAGSGLAEVRTLAQGARPQGKPPAASKPAASAARAEWPQWHGPKRDNVSTDTGHMREWGPNGPPLAWQASGLGAGFSSLSIANGRIYTMGDHGAEQFIEALSLQDGKLLWKTKVGPAHDDQYGGPRATPTIDNGLLYAVGTEGDLVCLDAATGQERWRRNLATDFGGQMMSVWKFSESPSSTATASSSPPAPAPPPSSPSTRRRGRTSGAPRFRTSARRAATAPRIRRS